MESKNKLRVEHPEMSAGELKILAERTPVSRSSHVGNQNLRELVLLTNFNLRQILVDSIHSEDKYTRPAHLLNGKEQRLASRSQAKNKVPSKVAIREGTDVFESPEINELIEQSKTIQDLHMASLGRLALSSGQEPILLSEMLEKSGDLGGALMEAAAGLGQVRRTVDGAGKIRPVDNVNLEQQGVFGLDDVSPQAEGALLPLEGMIVLDILETSAGGQSETVFHLGGKDMRAYTRDESVVSCVDTLLQTTRSLLGQSQDEITYSVIDVSQADRLAISREFCIKSQYDLIAQRPKTNERRVEIPPANYDTMLGGD